VERVQDALDRAGIEVQVRPETVAPVRFAALLRVLVDGG
jgi:hypothetical protein